MCSIFYCLVTFTCLLATRAEIVGNDRAGEDFCSSQPCGEGNTCFNTLSGYKCFCRPGDEREDCVKQEQCLLYNHTGVCRTACLEDETGFYISHLGGQFMDLRIYNKDGNVTLKNHVPIVDIKEQEPCMWQITGKPDCCVPTEDVKVGCFAYGSTVRTKDRGVIAVEDVRSGDLVESVDSDGGVVFSPVIMIMYQEPERRENMVEITTKESGHKLTLTHDHLAYVGVNGKWQYMYSEKVQPGMDIQVVDVDGSRVETVQSAVKQAHTGLYAPVTMTGTIVVDSVLASCYGNHPDHFLSHMVFAPVRWAYSYAPWVYDGDAVASDGSHPYVSFLNRHLRQLTGYSLVLTQHRLDGMTTYL